MDRAFRDLATRQRNARSRFLDWVMEKGFTREQAEHILAIYRQVKAIKIDVHGGQFTLTHHGYADPVVMRRALRMAIAPRKRRRSRGR